ncbi:MAG TPA: TIGR03435 family protein, partial [Candidatus Acidoferrales bacterium]|nr:TIGR03435 family protein [Candidatus Acidoferrales bacterium]
SGPKFKQSAPDAKFSGHIGVNGRNQTLTLTDATMDEIVEDIHIFTDRPVLDNTGLTGAYDIKFEATPAFRLDTKPDPHDISILTALPEQTGLKLESEKDMVDVVVLDHIEPPSPN